jgi:hypothetical protein
MTWRPKRRHLVLGSALSAVGVGWLASVELTRGFQDACDDASQIGARFARSYDKKAKELWAQRDARGDPEWTDYLRGARLRDIDEGKLVEVDGWWLPETELLVCVLAYRAHVDRVRNRGPSPC